MLHTRWHPACSLFLQILGSPAHAPQVLGNGFALAVNSNFQGRPAVPAQRVGHARAITEMQGSNKTQARFIARAHAAHHAITCLPYSRLPQRQREAAPIPNDRPPQHCAGQTTQACRGNG